MHGGVSSRCHAVATLYHLFHDRTTCSGTNRIGYPLFVPSTLSENRCFILYNTSNELLRREKNKKTRVTLVASFLRLGNHFQDIKETSREFRNKKTKYLWRRKMLSFCSVFLAFGKKCIRMGNKVTLWLTFGIIWKGFHQLRFMFLHVHPLRSSFPFLSIFPFYTTHSHLSHRITQQSRKYLSTK